MANFAKVNNQKVEQVIVADQDVIDNYVDTSPGTWIETTTNTRGGVHYDDNGVPDNGVALRFNSAGIGGNYDPQADAFYDAQPFPSWVLDKTNWTWQPPIPMPTDGKKYLWREDEQSWHELNLGL